VLLLLFKSKAAAKLKPADRFEYSKAISPTLRLSNSLADPIISRMAHRMKKPKRW
jgi:hypothetical protein